MLTESQTNLNFDKRFFSDLFWKVYNTDTRFVLNYGGTGSGKSYSQAQNEIIKLLTTSKGDTVVFRKTARSHKESTHKEIKEKIEQWGLKEITNIDFRYGGDSREIIFKDTGRKISFMGLDDPEKIKSLKGFQRAWLEEAPEFTQEDFFEINRRLRAFDNIQISLTFNPVSEQCWIKSFFVDNPEISKYTTVFVSTYKDNKYLTSQDIAMIEMYKDFDINQWNIYGQGIWGKAGVKKPFAFAFKDDKHLKDNLQIVKTLPVWLSFDFNVDPITCLVCQYNNQYASIIKEYRLLQSDIYELCERIKADFAGTGYYFKITGDASGKNMSALTRGNINYYQIIQNELRLSNYQFFVPSSNLSLKNSRVLCNFILSKFPVFIDRTCKHLIDDLLYCEVNELGELDKTKDKHRTHLLDCFRYFIDTNFLSYLEKNKLKSIV